MINRILPLLNKVIPSSMAKKALEKVNPHLKDYFANAASVGYGLDETLEFLRSQATPNYEGGRTDKYAAKGQLQASEFIPSAIGKGAKTALGSTAIAAIPTVLGNLFGEEEEQIPKVEQKRREQLKKANERQKKRSSMEEERERFENYYGQPQAQQQEQIGSGEQDLMAILQKINARLNQ